MNPKIVLSLSNITKRYPGVLALKEVMFELFEGEVHALVGENGAGKSTLIKAIAGAISLDRGTIRVNGHEYNHMTPHLSRSLGIEVIYQEFNLIPTMSVAENIFIGDRIGGKYLVDKKKMKELARQIFDQFKVEIDPEIFVRELSPAQRQIVEIAKAVSKDVKILIMDEPSAPLSVSEVEHMFEIINQLKQNGVSIIYISHRLDEVFRISDRVTVLRDGQYVETKLTKDTNRAELIRLMVGRELKETYPSRSITPSEVALEIKDLSGNGNEKISFSVGKGEILGLAGLVGAGRTELAMVICGAVPAEGGEILIHGKRVKINSPADAKNYRIGFLTEDRKKLGLFLEFSVRWNISYPIVRRISKYSVVNSKTEDQIAKTYAERLNIKTPSIEQEVKNLSGGNQQKVVLAKSLAAESDILIFDEPTRGIDVGAKQEIYHLMCDLANDGKAIIMISSDMEELLGMSDRIIVLFEGRLTGEISKEQFSQEVVLELASGTH